MDLRPELKDYYGTDNVYACYQCGTCTGGCPVHRYLPEYNVRQIVKDIIDGEIDLSDKSLWYCTTCYICYERCPQQVKPLYLVQAATNSAFKKGLAPESIKEMNRIVLKCGRNSEITSIAKKQRKTLGLPELKENVSEDYKKIAELTGLSKGL
ncbi:MAG: 4Fe-4S dicluster domain-containing protein [Deltaproteobacteria bacterium]|jgi:heterodisulfide reductase subunit C|nr:4Fe-4S dicluster domain-containing protein [Deltaproteobacteria bacterium]MBW2652935.1 4Fe-4S dicluster domain-containing protein [Deltaproteobacteria bacterium]